MTGFLIVAFVWTCLLVFGPRFTTDAYVPPEDQ